jgi:hypothetical protein
MRERFLEWVFTGPWWRLKLWFVLWVTSSAIAVPLVLWLATP